MPTKGTPEFPNYPYKGMIPTHDYNKYYKRLDKCDTHDFTKKAPVLKEWQSPTQDPIVNNVIHKFCARSDTGMKTYGTTMADNPLPTSEWINHAQEELMDAILYLERLKRNL